MYAEEIARYSPKGEHDNRLPHRLIAQIDSHWNGGVRWKLECPYEGVERPCALLMECTEHPRPSDPYHKPMVTSELEIDPEYREEIEAYEKAMEAWEDEHPHGSYHHTGDCWARWVIEEGDYSEPEYFLADIPRGTPLVGPLEVLLGARGHGEDQEPVFRLWNEIETENGERP